MEEVGSEKNTADATRLLIRSCTSCVVFNGRPSRTRLAR
jgi:hypothetical protein